MNSYIDGDTSREYFHDSQTYRKGTSYGAIDDLRRIIREFGESEVDARELLLPNQKAAMQRASDLFNDMTD